VGSAQGLAADEALCQFVAKGSSPPALHVYTYRPSVIVGRYQNLADAIDLDACRRHGYEWNRRHTGGGTVMMGPSQLAIGLVIPEHENSICSIRSHFRYFASVLSGALERFGIRAEFAGKNDLLVDGRKVAGLAISQDIKGVVFFHCSLLWDFDVRVMVDILNLSTRELDDRGHSCFAQRMTTIREHAPNTTLADLKNALRTSMEERHSIKSEVINWSPDELAYIRNLQASRYVQNDWIYSARVMKRWTGCCERRTPGGMLRVYVDCAGGVIDSVLITGDYFSRSLEIASLESALRGTPNNIDAVANALQSFRDSIVYRLSICDLASMIIEAASRSNRRFLAPSSP
jgi:lipoate-protein ligase A